MELAYTLAEDGIYYPDLVSDETNEPIGVWGSMRLRYLKEHRRVLYTTLKTECKLNAHLAEINRSADAMFELLQRQMGEREGLTEQLKRDDQWAWVSLASNIQSRAREVILHDIIYA
jgi:hypothetical protein